VTQPDFTIAPLVDQDRTAFDSGSEPLDRYFRNQATQDIRRRIAACYVAQDEAGAVSGFYTLSAADVAVTDLPPSVTKKLPRYPTLPAARIGRLAIDRRYQGLKLGAALLADAIVRASNSEIAVFAVIVDAKDLQAEAFYRHHGFESYGSAPGKMFAGIKGLLMGE
jgi:ribosomal protein S18 acetylase RimI-like enzyme